MLNKAPAAIASLLLISSCAQSDNANPDTTFDAATGGEASLRIVTINNYQEALDLFTELDYTPEAWQAGIRVVPRLYLSKINERWSKVTTKEIDVALKKRLFFRAIGPLALRSNELILADRNRLEEIIRSGNYADEQPWLQKLAGQYRLQMDDFSDDAALATSLQLRVDIVPPSLVLAPAAEESGWGTSRFAFAGNALFGQWTWGDKGIRPEGQRANKGDYKIASFDSPLQSVQAHAMNLNTHNAYREFRARRAELRDTGVRISGLALTSALTGYSERGTDYVKSLNSIINFNKLDPADDAYLDDKQPIVMINADIAEE
jgi:Bax protein